MAIFAFKNIKEQDRDCVSYVDIYENKIHVDCCGKIIICGPCYSSRLKNDEKYEDYQTVLSKEQFEAFKINNCPADMLKSIFVTLLSEDNKNLARKVMNDECEYIMEYVGVDKNTALDIMEDYPLWHKYFDRGMLQYWNNIEEWWGNILEDYISPSVIENLGLVENYNFDKIDVSDFGEYKELENGMIIEYLM